MREAPVEQETKRTQLAFKLFLSSNSKCKKKKSNYLKDSRWLKLTEKILFKS